MHCILYQIRHNAFLKKNYKNQQRKYTEYAVIMVFDIIFAKQKLSPHDKGVGWTKTNIYWCDIHIRPGCSKNR